MDQEDIIETEEIIEDEEQVEETGEEGKDNTSDEQTASEETVDFQDDNTNPPLKEEKAVDDEFIEDDKKIERAVEKAISPIIRQQEQARVDAEWNQIVNQYPEAKNMEGKVKRWATTEGSIYKGQSLKTVFREVAGEDFFLQVGAKRAAKAQKVADEDKSSTGTSHRPIDTGDGQGNKFTLVGKSAKEINEAINQVKSGRFQQ